MNCMKCGGAILRCSKCGTVFLLPLRESGIDELSPVRLVQRLTRRSREGANDMAISLKQHGWEGSLLEWIESSREDYFGAEILRAYQDWLEGQLQKPGNVLPFRLVSGRAPKGAEFVLADGTVLYAADNESLAGLWGLVAQRRGPPDCDLKDLLGKRTIPGSWPPNRMPTRFTCKWGPAPLALKTRGLKLAHLLDSGRNAIPVEPA